MSQERADLEELRDETKAFLSSRVYRAFLNSTKEDLGLIEEFILQDELEGEKDFYRLLGLRGQRIVLRKDLTIFEDAASTLDNRIEEMILAEQPSDAQQQE